MAHTPDPIASSTSACLVGRRTDGAPERVGELLDLLAKTSVQVQLGGGRMSYPNFYRRVWRPTVENAGLAGLHLHDLRKAFATHLAATGHTPSFIEDVMGHASYSTTMKYYTMTSDEESERARRELGDWLGREESEEKWLAA